MPDNQINEPLPHKIHPQGSVQAICSAAIGLVALLIAFVGYTAFNSFSVEAPWMLGDLGYLTFVLMAVVALVCVPWLATAPQLESDIELSMHKARRFFAVGALCTVLGVGIFIIRDFAAHHI